MEWVDRRTVEETLGVSKTVAWRILRGCGGVEGPGHSLVCGREEMVRALEELQKTGKYEWEVRRRERLEERLMPLMAAARARGIRIAEERRAIEMARMRFQGLPAGVEFERERLTIEFSGMQDFLAKVGAVVYALRNDYDAVSAFVSNEDVVDGDGGVEER